MQSEVRWGKLVVYTPPPPPPPPPLNISKLIFNLQNFVTLPPLYQPLPDVRFSVNNTLMVENVAGRKNRGSRGFFSATLAKRVAGI